MLTSSLFQRMALALFVLALVLALMPMLAHAQSSLGIGNNDGTTAPTGPFAGFFAWINAQQRDFYRAMTNALKTMKDNPAAGALVLAGLSFAYGVLHAAGPGHGKAVISSYVVANEVTLKRGIALSFLSAMAQALTALLVVGAAFLILRGSAVRMTDAERFLEIASYALIAAFGAWLTWKKLRKMFPRLQPFGLAAPAPALALAGHGAMAVADHASQREIHGHEHAHPHRHGHDHHHNHGHEHGGEHHRWHGHDQDHDHSHDHGDENRQAARMSHAAHAHHDHVHDHHHGHGHGHGHGHVHGHSHSHDHGHAQAHDHHHAHSHAPGEVCADCGHAHMPDPAMLRESLDARAAWSAVLAVGLRPCSGAIIVLTFALLNGLYLGGILSVFAMAVGTAITVSVLASLAVFAKTRALRFYGDRDSAATVLNGIELAGALVVLLLGLVLLRAALL